MQNCKICGKKSISEFCSYHELAYQNLQKKFEDWKKAIGDISWEEYLKRIIDLPHAGEWVKELAKYFLSSSGEST